MVERYISHEQFGKEGAEKKALMLRDEMGYKIKGIEHTQVPMSGSTSTPYSSTWGKTEPGYSIIVDTEGYAEGEDTSIPEIVNC